MNVVLNQQLFEAPSNDPGLIAILEGGANRYRIRLLPVYEVGVPSPFASWLLLQSASVRDVCLLAVERGLREPEYALEGRVEPTLIVERRLTPDWPDSLAMRSARVPLSDARALLARPLRLLLENARNDMSFLRRAVPDAWRERFESALANRWIEPEQGGGLEEIRELIEQEIAPDDVRRLRTWVMFDGDGRRSGHHSASSVKARQACEDWAIPFHQLIRRAIENYIPIPILHQWAEASGSRRTKKERRARVLALKSLSAPQRHYFNMKKGFKGDRKSAVDSQYDGLPSSLVQALEVGFGGKLAAEAWSEAYTPSERDFAMDAFTDERSALFQSMMGAL